MKILMCFVAMMILNVSVSCASAKPALVEDQERYREELTDTHDWTSIEEVAHEILGFRNQDALQYEWHGVYNLENRTSKVYTFDAPNDFYEVVVMDDEEDFIFIIHNLGSHGISFHSVIYKGGKFHGLTANYILFQEGSDIIAVSIKEKPNPKVGEYVYDVVSFSELSKEEQKSAVYPTGNYICKF